tara:strand:+ start:2032 stop:2511 length:480 start_codon:yes stop_codon:yes gene_type:complete
MTMPSFTFTCSKKFEDFPCCHRQWKHLGHCHFVHGYSRSFTFWFGAKELDQNGFVVDFSSLRKLEEKLIKQFDHTFLINDNDPLLLSWKKLHEEGALDLRIMKNVGMESSAELVWEWANSVLQDQDKGRTCCWRTESRENDSNAACFELIPDWFRHKEN